MADKVLEELRRIAAWESRSDMERNAVRGAIDEIVRLRATLQGIAEFCSGDDSALGAISRLAAVRNTAERALVSPASHS